MGIDFSKFSQEIQAKIKAALEDAKSPNKIDAAELRAMNLEKDIANKLIQELCGNYEYLGDGYIKAQNKDKTKTLILLDNPQNNTFIPLTNDSLRHYRSLYGNENIAQGVYRDGKVYLADTKGHLVKDRFNNYISEEITFNTNSVDNDNNRVGGFEIIENEAPERTNRRFAIALVRSMYNDMIQELKTIASQMGVLDVGLWREALGMGIQAIADLKKDQELITATTEAKIKRIESDRDNICNSLNDLLDSPTEFESKFYQLAGKDYRDNAFSELREIQHNQTEKDQNTRYKECISKFKELYADSKILDNIESWESSVEFQKTIDGIANIVVMLVMTGEIGKLFQGSVQTMAKNILLAAAKGDKKAVLANFSKLAPEVQTVWKSLAKKEFGVAAAQTVTPITQSVATMSSWEGIKSFLNNLTNAEEMSAEELLNRTLEGFMSGAEMGAIMGGLETFAIAPVMTKLTPVLHKLSGATAEISATMEKSGGIVPMEKVMETFSKTSGTLRGKIVQEGTHGIVALPVLTVGFTATDSFIHYNEAEFRKSLLDAATTDEEREAINNMNSVDLRIEFAKNDFINQVKGMATIEGIGLIFRRLQAGRIAAQSTAGIKTPDFINANLREVKENGKSYYEICTQSGEVLPVNDGNRTITRFSGIEEATSAYSALCLETYSKVLDAAEKLANNTDSQEVTQQPTSRETEQKTAPEVTEVSEHSSEIKTGAENEITVEKAGVSENANINDYDLFITDDNKLIVTGNDEKTFEQTTDKPTLNIQGLNRLQTYKIKVNGKIYTLSSKKELTKEEICTIIRNQIYTTKDSRQFTNPKLKEVGEKIENNLLRSRMLDVDSMLNSVKAGEYINAVLSDLTPENASEKMEEIELYLQALFELNGKSVNYTSYKDSAAASLSVLGRLSPLAKISRYIRNSGGKKLDEIQQMVKDGTIPQEVKQGGRAFATDADFEQRWHSAIIYMAKYPNSIISDKFFDRFVKNKLATFPDIAEKVTEINKRFNVKIIIPTKFNKKEVEKTLEFIENELSKWETASNKLANIPPVLYFNSAAHDRFQTQSGDFLSGGVTKFDIGNMLCFPLMNLSTVKHALRHELVHANDKQLINHSEEADVFTVDKNNYQSADISELKYAKELKDMGLDDNLIQYAHTSKAELLAVAGQGDLSKCTPEFKKYLIDNGMPEWVFELEPQKTLIEGRFNKEPSQYTRTGNIIFEVKPQDTAENPEKITKIREEIETLRKTEPQKAEELQIVLDMFTNPTSVHDVTDAQIDAIVNYLNDHYDILEDYLTEQADKIGISGERLGRFGHRIKGEWSTRDKIVNYINDSIEKEQKAKEKGEAYTPRTLLDAYRDVRDKYACRTVFTPEDYTKHPDVSKLINEANELKAQGKTEEYGIKMHEAELRAAELQSEQVFDSLKDAMKKAKDNNADLTMMRISNYTSKDGIPILSERQLSLLKSYGESLDIDVSFIKLADANDPKRKELNADDTTTKSQPSGYTALQINFVTKTGEIIEWQFRGDLVNDFAEAEHLPYDIRTGKHPWNQYPELETLFKPVADLLDEKVMPKHAYKQLNKYFTDYYTHLRRLELGFESEEPRLEDYEHYEVEEKDGTKTKHTYKFDKRLSAKSLEALHFYGEGIKDGVITPEQALKEYNAEVGVTERKDTDFINVNETESPIGKVGKMPEETMIRELKSIGIEDSDIAKIDLNTPNLSAAIELLMVLKEYKPENIEGATSAMITSALIHADTMLKECGDFVEYVTRDNLKLLSEVMDYEGEEVSRLSSFNINEVFRVAKRYFEQTGEKLPSEVILNNNYDFMGKEGVFPTNEQIDFSLKMVKAGLWTEYNMWGKSVKLPEINNPDKLIADIKSLTEKTSSQVDLSLENNLTQQGIDDVYKLIELDSKTDINYSHILAIINKAIRSDTYRRLEPQQILFYRYAKEKNISDDVIEAIFRNSIPAFVSPYDIQAKYELAKYCIDNGLIDKDLSTSEALYNLNTITSILRQANHWNTDLAKALLENKDFPNERISSAIKYIEPSTYNTDIKSKSDFAYKLCTDKSLNCPIEIAQELIIHYADGCEEKVFKELKSGLLSRHPKLAEYPADCWDNILKRNLTGRDMQQISRNIGYDATVEYARAKDDNIVEKHMQLRADALANKDLLKSGLEDITDWEVKNVTNGKEAIRTIDLIGLGNTEAAFPLMLEEFGEFLRETASFSNEKLSQANKELLLERINPAQTQKAKSLNEEITELKKQINIAVGKENLAKIKEIQKEKAGIDASISDLKVQLDNARMAIPEYKELSEKIKNLNQKSQEYKDFEKQMLEIENNSPEIVNLKNSIKELQKQSKALNGQAQSIYYSCENAAKVRELMKQLSPKQKELKEFLTQYSGIEPQDAVTKIRVLSALCEISTDEEMTEFIKMIKPSSPENNAAWNEAINRKIFQKLNIEYDEALSKKLDLINCKYISKLFVSNVDFFDNMRILVEVIKANPDLTIEQAIDQMPQNIETKRIFEEIRIDYEKFTKVDKNSFTKVKVKLSAEEAKQASIHNLEEDLNDVLFQSLPQKATGPIFNALKEEAGVTLVKSQKDNWVGDGFNAGSSEYYRLYKNGQPITFEDMDKIVTIIKREINKNDFWTTTQGDEQLDNARKTMYTHLIKLRASEVDNASTIKDGEIAEIEVRKTDMYDVKKALGLGNDAQCCTALGRNHNEWSAPTYIMNKCIGAIELTDRGHFVGNTMIYFAYVDGKPALVLDNIELKTKYQNNDKIRDTFIDYAKKLCEEIGQPDLPIYAGPNRHKLNMDIYPKEKHSMDIIGNSGEQEVYVDYDGAGHIIGQSEQAEIDMYKIR